ncbi:SDR family NAD(P)-dependent oxidoreductase [Streptosporangium carneum]|uniref:3-oxoacyl-ACP reductase n=1 Tax=Streptosporangium carneum TaxID=47481 RepID=A0A9W6MIC1_9ACTN|nr:SDR family oxidoreductase [Streptosporangium carneum]GLK14833.1 3-oxoacyl-ACP reductase [Streptosporangium carneum]
MPELTGKVALVTGGGRGIGAEIARRLASHGADVAVTYVQDDKRANGVVEEIGSLGRRGLAIRADAADHEAAVAAVERTAAEFGRLDILVNNAGIWAGGPFQEVSLEDFDRVIAVNVRAVFATTQAATRHLGEGGRIINVGSCQGERVSMVGQSLYSLSKAALTGFTKAVAFELGPRGITVNLVAPGPVTTEMIPEDPELIEHLRGITAVGRFGTTAEIAAVVAYLAGPESGFTTGTTFTVDGGANI